MSQEGELIRFAPGTSAKDLSTGTMRIVSSTDAKGHPLATQEQAKAIFGEDFLGPQEVSNALDITIHPKDIPSIQFSEEELRRGKELDMRLVLRVSKTAEGTPITMKWLNTHLQSKVGWQQKILYNTVLYKDDPFFTHAVPETRWSLVTNKVIPNSTNKNYLEQTEVIANYLRDEVFQRMPLPKEYEDAIQEFEEQKAEIQELIVKYEEVPQKEAVEKFIALKLTQLTRATPVDTLFDQLVCFKKADKRLLEDKYTWTFVRATDGRLVIIGRFDSHGLGVLSRWPSAAGGGIGVLLSL